MSQRIRILAVALAAVASAGSAGRCSYTPALRPVLTTEDLVFDSTLLGSWIRYEIDQYTVFVLERPDTSAWYELSTISSGPVPFFKKDTAVFRVGLARFGDAWVADVYPSDDWSAHVIPVHQIVRLWPSRDSLTYADLSGEWFGGMIQLDSLRVPHHRLESNRYGLESVLYLLSASTGELQDLLRWASADSSAFSDKTTLYHLRPQ